MYCPQPLEKLWITPLIKHEVKFQCAPHPLRLNAEG
jgi:hypothetical protein